VFPEVQAKISACSEFPLTRSLGGPWTGTVLRSFKFGESGELVPADEGEIIELRKGTQAEDDK
jgi:hypothetical protein